MTGYTHDILQTVFFWYILVGYLAIKGMLSGYFGWIDPQQWNVCGLILTGYKVSVKLFVRIKLLL